MKKSLVKYGGVCVNFPLQMILGRTRMTTKTKSRITSADLESAIPREIHAIRSFYRDEMLNIFTLLFPDLNISEICAGKSDKKLSRFIWLMKYICLE